MARYLLSLALVLVILAALGGIYVTVQAQTRTVRNRSARVKVAKKGSHSTVPQRRGLEDILTDQSLWGDRFPLGAGGFAGTCGRRRKPNLGVFRSRSRGQQISGPRPGGSAS